MTDARYTRFWGKIDVAWSRIMRYFHYGIYSCVIMCLCLTVIKFWPHVPTCVISFLCLLVFAVNILTKICTDRYRLALVGPRRSLGELPEAALIQHGHAEEVGGLLVAS